MDMPALVSDWTQREIPVLAGTAAALRELGKDEDRTSARDISRVVLRDPLMTLRVLRHAEINRSSRQPTDITTVEHAVMMRGISRFFRDFAELPVLETQLASDGEALHGALTVISRAQHAAVYARAMASHRVDLETDEVIIGALLHDLAELLLWCHEPRKAALIRYLLEHAPGVRSAGVQSVVLGFSNVDLTLALADAWRLPPLLRRLMDDHHAARPRVVNVVVAAALARHTAQGWNDPAIPDDLNAVRSLTGLKPEASYRLVRNASLQAAAWWRSTGVRPAAARFPSIADPAASTAVPESHAEASIPRFREALSSLKQAPPGTEPAALAAMTLYALHKGLGMERAAWGEVDERTGQLHIRLALGDVRPGLRGYRMPLDDRHLFVLLLQKTRCVFATGERRERLVSLLDAQGRSTIGANDFVAMSLVFPGRPRVLFLADHPRSGQAIDEKMLPAFRAACIAFARCVASAPNR